MLDIESTFYDSLTKDKLEKYESLLVEISAAAKQCGGVHRSPFENVNLSEYSLDVRNSVYYSAEVLLAEIKHVKNYLSLFLDFYRQRISTFTQKKMQTLLQLIALLQSGELEKYFKCDEKRVLRLFQCQPPPGQTARQLFPQFQGADRY